MKKLNQNHLNQSHDLLEQFSHSNLIKVVIESRFSSDSLEGIVRNKKYTLACMRDSFLRGEAPYASHVIYAHPHFLDDYDPTERAVGMHAGFLWGDLASKTVVYTDLGISSGMQLGIQHAESINRPVEYRTLGYIPNVTPEEVKLEEEFIKVQKQLLDELKNEIHPQKICLSSIYKKVA